MQVVRAVVDQRFWRELNSTGRVASESEPTERLSDALRRAIDLKAHDSKIPANQRPQLVLVLDATRLPGVTLDTVVMDFRQRHSDWARSLGFEAAWLVGPTWLLTWRLDTA